MASELQIATEHTGETYYAVIRNSTGQVWSVSGAAFETYSTGNLGNYDVAMTEQGTASRYYAADMPSGIPAGEYVVAVYLQIGGSPAETDSLAGTAEFHWDGTTMLSRNAVGLKDGAITAAKIAAGTLSAAKLAADFFTVIQGPGFTSPSDTLHGIRQAIDTLVAPNINTNVTATTPGIGGLSSIIDEIRQLVNQPRATSEFDDASLIRYINYAWQELFIELNRWSEKRPYVRLNIDITTTTDLWELPPVIGRVIALEKISPDGRKVTLWEADSRNFEHPYGVGWSLEQTAIRFEPRWNTNETMRVVYIPSGAALMHEATVTSVSEDGTTIDFPGSVNGITIGTLDTRANAYAGYVLEVLDATYPNDQQNIRQIRMITAYDNLQRRATLSQPLSPIPVFESSVTYQVVPLYDDLCFHAIAVSVAKLIAGAIGDTTREGSLLLEHQRTVATIFNNFKTANSVKKQPGTSRINRRRTRRL